MIHAIISLIQHSANTTRMFIILKTFAYIFNLKKMTIKFIFLILTIIDLHSSFSIGIKNAGLTNFRGYKVIRIYPQSHQDLNCILTIENQVKNVDFWSEPRTIGQTVDLMVPPGQFVRAINYFNERKINFDILIEDVQYLLNMQQTTEVSQQLTQRSFSPSSAASTMSWSRYHRLKTIYNYMAAVAQRFPNLAKLITIGKTFEGRPIQVLKIGRDSGKPKPGIWIDGGIHAREWISPATVTYIIEQLIVLNLRRSNPASNKYLDEIDWYLLPVVNPDGYEYTHTSARMWRKNRAITTNLFCRGVDINRNFGFFWNVGGASNRTCAENYAGPAPHSELETKAIAQFILARNSSIKIFITTHSYGQLLLTPWGYTARLPDDYLDLYALAKVGANAIKSVHGTDYTIGTSTNVLYVASGGSDDWAKGAAGIKYAYTIELRDNGRYGFLLPPSQIVSTGKETWMGIKAMAEILIP